jgi:hypothetical protein
MRRNPIGTAFVGCAVVAAVAAGAGCTIRQQPAPAATTARATTERMNPPSPAARATDVSVAFIDALDARTVSWQDGEIVPSTADNQVSKQLPGLDHRHIATLAGNAVFYTPTGCSGAGGDLRLDANGLGTVPCTKDAFLRTKAALPETAEIRIDAGGQVDRIAIRYQP